MLSGTDLFEFQTTPPQIKAVKSATPVYKRSHCLSAPGASGAVADGTQFRTEVEAFVRQNYSSAIIIGDTGALNDQSLDIWLPEIRFAINTNDSWKHSELGGADRTQHFDKTNACRGAGITLFHLWQHHWQTKRGVIESMLRARMQLSVRIPARKCEVRTISHAAAREFFEANHIQGSAGSKFEYGLFFQDRLVMAISLARPRYSKDYEWELIRLAALRGHTIVGGASRLIARFVRDHNPSNILSYADRSYGTGEVYRQLGFTLSHVSGVNYWYTLDNLQYYHRSRFQKHKLNGMLEGFDANRTEWENMTDHGWNRIFDAGNDVFVWRP